MDIANVPTKLGGAFVAALFALTLWGVQPAQGAIQVVPGSVFMFRDIRGANDVGIAQGDRFQFGADIVGGSATTFLGATYGPQDFFIVSPAQLPCGPLTVDPNFCSRTTDSANVLGTTTNPITRLQPWTISFENLTDPLLAVSGPSLTGTDVVVPFPKNVTISNSGLTPTISWTIPNGFVPDGFRVQIFDRDTFRPGTTAADVIQTQILLPTATSFTIPAGVLQANGHYDINLQVVETRPNDVTPDPNDHLPFTGNPSILVRSNSFFDFSPLSGGPPDIHLPTIVNGVYNFSVTDVGPTSVTFIDPLLAIGYDYAIGAGDPNFASVLLPTGIGDNLFDLFLWNGTSFFDSGINLVGGVQFFFAALGVDRFEIRGIEASAGLDPANPTAFITGLTFVSSGNFTGTMTPLTVDVPTNASEPSTLVLIAIALLGFVALGRRRISGR